MSNLNANTTIESSISQNTQLGSDIKPDPSGFKDNTLDLKATPDLYDQITSGIYRTSNKIDTTNIKNDKEGSSNLISKEEKGDTSNSINKDLIAHEQFLGDKNSYNTQQKVFEKERIKQNFSNLDSNATRNQFYKYQDHLPSDENKYQGRIVNKYKDMKEGKVVAEDEGIWEKTKEVAHDLKESIVHGAQDIGETVKQAFEKTVDYISK
jgi:hypothetical protein